MSNKRNNNKSNKLFRLIPMDKSYLRLIIKRCRLFLFLGLNLLNLKFIFIVKVFVVGAMLL